MGLAIFQMLVFPGVAFLSVAGLIYEFMDRKLYARFQNRMGPPWFQPLADFIKLISKEEVIPCDADKRLFRAMPVVALATTVTAFFYIPLWKPALFSFRGDLVVVLYLLTIPTLTYFLGGWYSRSVYSALGAARSLTQLFAYEVPLFLCVLAPALLAGTWSLQEITAFYGSHPWLWMVNLPGFIVALVTLLGKLEKVPFDTPEAETEIVAGSFTEYSGRLLAIFRMAIDIELVVVSALLAAVFLPFGLELSSWLGFLVWIVKITLIVFLVSLARTAVARLRIDQMMTFCWKWIAPAAFLQVVLNLVLKGVVLP